MKIKDICTSVTDGSHNPPQGIDNSKYIMLSSKNVFDDKITFDEPRFLSEEDFKREHKRTKISVGDVLLTIVGTVGRTAVVDEDMPSFALQRSVAVLHPKPDVCLPRFLMYALRGKRPFIENRAKGVAQKGIYLKEVSDIDVQIPDILDQEMIINQLDKVNTIVKFRQEELFALDDLIKARFVEMFGDARKNPNKYDTVSFIDIVEYMGDIGSNGANKVVVDHLDMKDKEDYAMMVRFTNFTKNDFTDDVKYVSKEAYDFFKKSQIFGGELIICKIGSAGQNYVMPYLNRPVSLGLNQIMVRIKDNILMPYLYQYLHTDYGEFLISRCINGAVTKTITKTELKKIPVMLPPMELQREFVAFVEQVDKSKVAVQKALDETQKLFNSLMQQYFG